MGCTVGKNVVAPSTEAPEKGGMNIEQFLKDEKTKQLTNFKVLLLGAGESGKSTVIKQLKTIHKVPMGSTELNLNKKALHSNSLTSMQKHLEAAAQFGMELTTEEEKKWRETVLSFTLDQDTEFLSSEVAEAIANLWASPVIQKVHERRHEFWHLDACEYYFSHVLRFVAPHFTPTEEDCIFARIRTTGISLTEFDQGPVHFTVVDVGGQRSERKKWIHCFDDVKVVSLAGYNQVLFEDEERNRMDEALDLFRETAENKLFQQTPLFLFLNKKDLFEAMIQQVDLSTYFAQYRGGSDVTASLTFLEEQFRLRVPKENSERLSVFPIAARFKKDVKYAWEDITKILLQKNKHAIQKSQSL